ncbi:MAG: hypothetical protein U5L01_08850 [Rheinheimera sp.]|nr:hypothetical protein [Rheinheimera sp.]
MTAFGISVGIYEMYQVVAITLDPALLSLLKHYCQQDDQSWQLRSFPTVGRLFDGTAE